MKNYKEFPEYIRKLPWKFDVERLQEDLQSIKRVGTNDVLLLFQDSIFLLGSQ